MPDGFGWSQTGGEYFFFIDAHGTIFSDIWNVKAERSEKPADIGILASACGSEDDSFFMKCFNRIIYFFRHSLLIVVKQSSVQIQLATNLINKFPPESKINDTAGNYGVKLH